MFVRWRQAEGLTDDAAAERLLTPYSIVAGKRVRYYQESAINRAVQALLQGRKRVLLTMSTGSGKTLVAFEICWKLWASRWNRSGEHRRPPRARLGRQEPRDVICHLPGHRPRR